MIMADVAHAVTALVGCSPAIQHLRELVARLAPLSLPVLIEGPTGVGKELVARGLHSLSGRNGSHVALNVCAVPDTMFEATLFGHVRGAFTGALSDSPGYVGEANGGTLFLDEIGGLPLGAQAKLLRVLETQEYRPVGARRDRRSDFRLSAATNEELEGLVAAGCFRADLAQRLSGFVLRIPPLAERPEDIAPLTEHFLSKISGPAPRSLTRRAKRILEMYAWPGNVRELRNVVERAAVMAPSLQIDGATIAAAMAPTRVGMRDGEYTTTAERTELVELLELCAWDTVAAARLLGVHRATIYRRMERLRVVRPSAHERGAISESREICETSPVAEERVS